MGFEPSPAAEKAAGLFPGYHLLIDIDYYLRHFETSETKNQYIRTVDHRALLHSLPLSLVGSKSYMLRIFCFYLNTLN